MSSIDQAKKFLVENPTESRAMTARIFDIKPKSLTSSIRRDSGNEKEGQNKILQDHEMKALDAFITSLLIHQIPPTSGMVFGAIIGLKKAHDRPAPSKRWFRG
jgi:hypothetical protein